MNLKDVSEIKDWKIIPRLMMLAITIMAFYVTNWMISLPDPTINQTSFASIIFGCFSLVYGRFSAPCDMEHQNLTKRQKCFQ